MSEINVNDFEIPFHIQRIYIKDISFEVPNSPFIFNKHWDPKTEFNLNTISKSIGSNIFEVIIKVTVTVSLKNEIAFLCEIQQAGIFFIVSIDDIDIQKYLGIHFPNILFPYARECITNIISRGTFPQLNLAPINFNKIYMKYIKENIKQN